jgi:NAD(P)-dependent dehydrogenase (short-subunit alcohol dehydrogenase family)
MTNPILVTGAAGRVGGVGRTITKLLLKQGKTVRAMVRNEDERAQALRDDQVALDQRKKQIPGRRAEFRGLRERASCEEETPQRPTRRSDCFLLMPHFLR